jgi:hypothetical protein
MGEWWVPAPSGATVCDCDPTGAGLAACSVVSRIRRPFPNWARVAVCAVANVVVLRLTLGGWLLASNPYFRSGFESLAEARARRGLVAFRCRMIWVFETVDLFGTLFARNFSTSRGCWGRLR